MIRSPEGVDGSLDMNDLAEVSPAVRLRAVEDDDLDVLFSQQADPVAAAMAEFPARDREQVDTHWARIRRDDTVLLRTILANGVIAGNIGSWQAEGQRLIGYWTGRQYWGRGGRRSVVAHDPQSISSGLHRADTSRIVVAPQHRT